MSAVAARGSTIQVFLAFVAHSPADLILTCFQQGVTSVNPLVDIVQFFSQYIAQDLQAASGVVHPILEVDAIRFLYTFRNQVFISDH